MYLRIPALLNEEQLVTIRSSLNSEGAPWVDGRVTAGHQGMQVKHNQQLEEGSVLARDLGGLVIAQLERHPLFVSAVLPNRVYPPMFNRYGAGMQFGAHVDGAVRSIAGTAQRLRTDLSATLFMSAPDSYEGGELLVDRDLGGQGAKYPAGDLLVYSAASRHRVSAVTRGVRLACVFWIQSLVREDGRREQLFELDRTIQRLTHLGSDADCLLRLTAHYHNLLRAWADV
jgi:PKHD-type hydroxylase